MFDVDRYLAACFSGWALDRLTLKHDAVKCACGIFFYYDFAYGYGARPTFAALLAFFRKFGDDRRTWPQTNVWGSGWRSVGINP